MSFGKSSGSGTTTVTPILSPEQNKQIAATTGFLTGTQIPATQQAITGATNMYNASAGGVNNAAQNLAGTAAQAQNLLGTTGESALKTGIGGLQNLFTPDYEKQQLQAALQPAEAQYAQNIANQQAMFGGAGQIGSARNSLTGAQTAGAAQAAQMNASAQVEANIAAQRAAAAQSLIGAGQANISGAQSAAGQQITAAMTPQQLYNQYASILYGVPSGTYTPNFSGSQGSTTVGNKTGLDFGIKI
jgi:hypothetical protein